MTSSAKLSTKKAVRGSRIRREPPPAPRKLAPPPSRERDIMIGIAGIILFALAIATLTVSFSAITADEHQGIAIGAPPPPAAQGQQPSR